jgi:hypothetical protein
MRTVTWRGTAIATLLVVTVAGCAHENAQQRQAAAAPAATPAQQAQRNAENAMRQAATTEQQLAQARQRLEAKRQESARAEQQRAQARQQVQQADQRAAAIQQQIGQEQSGVARLEAAAREQREAATEAQLQAQIAAEEAQGLRSEAGRIAQAGPTRVVLEVQGGRTMSFQIDPRTRVLVGTEQRSVTELQQGAEARVAYDPRESDPAAVAIHVNSAGRRMAPPAQQPPPAQPQPAPQQR